MKKIVMIMIIATITVYANRNQIETPRDLIYALIESGQNVLADDIIEEIEKDKDGNITSDDNNNDNNSTNTDCFRTA